MKTTISRNSIRSLLLSALVLVCFAVLPKAQAVNPTPDGLYPGANTAEGGSGALFSLTTGTNNTAIGSQALFSLAGGSQNTAVGAQALKNNVADMNTAIGFQALVKNTAGDNNTATGWRALFQNTAGDFNTADGAFALFSNRTASANTANGFAALASNTTGGDNTATGFDALVTNTTGGENTAIGESSLTFNTTGSRNTANGRGALNSNTTADENTAMGVDALARNSIGNSNIALGASAGVNLTTGDNNIDIGNEGVPEEASTIRIGTQGTQTKTFIAGISGVNEGGTISQVFINTNGQLGTQAPPSSRRFKKEIKPMDNASEAILALKPVTFHYKSNKTATPQFGLIAEDVAEVNPDLVVRDNNGEIYTVRYDAVNAMLLNEFLKEHRTVQELKSVVAKQEAAAAQQQKQIEALTAGLQKVSAQLQASKPAPQVVNNP
jgi:hypothetical protein